MTPEQRTNDMLKGLDHMLEEFSKNPNNKNIQIKIETNLRWITTYLDKEVIIKLLQDSYDIENNEAIIYLLKQKEFDVNQYN